MADDMQQDIFSRLNGEEKDLEITLRQINPERLYRPDEAASRILDCSIGTIYKLVRTGALRGFRVGSGIRIFGWSLIDYICSQDTWKDKK